MSGWPEVSKFDRIILSFDEGEMLVLDQMLHRMWDHQQELWPALNAAVNPFWPAWLEEDVPVIQRLLEKICPGDHTPIA